MKTLPFPRVRAVASSLMPLPVLPLLILVTALPGWGQGAGSLKAEKLRCEYRQDPVGVEAAQPRFSWVLTAVEPGSRNLRQSACQILVASSPELLAQDRGDLWDSGKVASSQTVNVEYAGAALVSEQECFWKVRSWDQDGQACDWSAAGRWTMGLLQPEDWKAQWIGFDGDPDSEDPQVRRFNELLTLRDCSWVWVNGSVAGNQPPGGAQFRKTIELPADRRILRAAFAISGDDRFHLMINGQTSAQGRDFKAPVASDVSTLLTPGKVVLAIAVNNEGKDPNPAGLLGKLVVQFETGDPLVVPVDATWKSMRRAKQGWNQPDFDDRPWKTAAVVGKFGDAPWGEIQLTRFTLRPAPYLRKGFTVSKPLRRARLFASALGVYELHVNGRPLNQDVLSPGWTDYHKRVHYFGYDLTSSLRPGENALGAILGDGWYAGYLAFSGRRQYYGEKPRFLAHLRLDYADGSSEVLGTDASWKASYGPIRENDLLMGCTYDARLEAPGWNGPGFDDSTWQAAVVDGAVRANLEAHPAPPIRRMEEIPAKEITEPKPGVYVVNLGQNMVGWARLRLQGSKGRQVTVRHAEMLNPDGSIYVTNLRAAKATDTYYLDGGPKRAYEPCFTFHGFQYVEITGVETKPALEDITGVVVYSALPRSGHFTCSEPLVNKLVENTVWGQKGNFLDVPTDCPQRDERAGWTGDAQVFMKTACLNLEAPAFFTKWLTDLCQDSQNEEGGFGDVAPHINIVRFGNTGWADAGVVCNERMFQMYEDRRVVRQHYPALVRYLDYLARTSTDFTRGTGSYGDWLRLAGPQHSQAIGTAYYYYSASLMAGLADVAGKPEDVRKYRELAAQIKSAFVAHYLKPDGRIVDDKNETGQSFYALAFGLDLVPAERREQVAQQFVEEIKKQDWHLATGFLGTPFVLFALEKAGQKDLAYRLALNDTYPSWLLQVKLGSTTMWERWDGWTPEKGFQNPGMNSFNHYWLGCIGEWLQCSVAGIDTEGPGFARIRIRPVLASAGQGLNAARGSYESIRGLIVSDWKREADRLSLQVTIPANTTATVYVPAKEPGAVLEGGKPAQSAPGLQFLRMEDGYAIYAAGSGQYGFTSRM